MIRRPALLGILVLLLILSGCTFRQRPRQGAGQAATVERPELESWDVRFTVSQGGRQRVRFEAPYMVQYRRGDSLETRLQAPAKQKRRVTAYLFGRGSGGNATLTARELRYSNRTGTYEAKGSVRVVSSNGRRLETEHLIWLEADQKVRTTDFVRIITPTERLQGYNLIADEDLQNYTLSHITGIVTIQEGE